MFGLEFLFGAALFALPLAALPLLLHLLYRRKSPVVLFPTLEFIKQSLQHNAARRKIQKWLLLAIRILMLALLIWAVAQPAKILASRFFSSAVNSAAVVVVDTSWSMDYREQQLPLLARADAAVQQLLRDQLRDDAVLLITAKGTRGTFRSSTELLANWVPLENEPSPRPLVDRVMEGVEVLEKNPAGEKVLIVLSDFQEREFPRPVPEMTDKAIRLVAIDLHPSPARSAGVAAMALTPQQPVAGLRTTIKVDVAGPPGEVRPVLFRSTSLDGRTLAEKPVVMATMDDSGHGQVGFDLEVPGERWQLLTAKLSGEDPMPWDDTRTCAVEMPGRAKIVVLDGNDSLAPARRVVRLALDPSEGKLTNWPLQVAPASALTGSEEAAVVLLERWPDVATVNRMRDLVTRGGTLVLMLRPGMETQWAQVPEAARKAMEQLLPSAPYQATEEGPLHAMPQASAKDDPATGGLVDAKGWDLLKAQRLVPMRVEDPSATMLVGMAKENRRAPADREGLLFARKVGRGKVYTWAVTPDGTNTNVATHALFLPVLVDQCLRPSTSMAASNTVIGEPIAFIAEAGQSLKELQIKTPGGEVFRVPGQMKDGREMFAYQEAMRPGVYEWRRGAELKGIANVSIAGGECEATYRRGEDVLPAGEHTLVVRNVDELKAKLAQISRPEPKWSMPIAIALMLLSVEAMLSTGSTGWRWLGR